MTDAGIFSAVFVVGVAASIIGTMAGGGSLLSIPLPIFLGLPPHVAIATDRFAGLGVGATALYRFWPSGKIMWRYVPALALASRVGSLIGATWLIRAEPGALRAVVGALLLVLLPLLFLKPDLGVAPREVGRLRVRLGLVLYLLVQILAGFFGGGTGTLIFFILMSCFGVTVTQVAATQILPFLALTLSSLILFAFGGIIDYRFGTALLAGTAVGGYVGAHLAIARGDRWVRRVLAVIVLVSGVRLLL